MYFLGHYAKEPVHVQADLGISQSKITSEIKK